MIALEVFLWNGGNAAFSNAAFWTNVSLGGVGTVPGSQDFAIINGVDGQIISGAAAAGFLEVRASTTFTGTITVPSLNEAGSDYLTAFQVRDNATATFGAGSSLTVNNENALIGFSQTGSLALTAGADMTVDVTQLTSSMYIGGAIVGEGGSSVTVDGAGTTLTVDAGIQVSAGSSASLSVTNGALLTMGAENAFGFYVGANDIGAGTFNLNTGADVVNTGFTNIGRVSGSAGTAIVEDAGTTWTDVSIAIGYEGTGSLTLRDQATITTIALSLGTISGTGTLDVQDANSILSVTDFMTVGGALSDGGAGTVNVSNSGRINVANSLIVWGDGTLNLSTGGTINAPVVNNGILQATDFNVNLTDKVLTINGAISGTGTIKLQGDSTLVVDGTVGAGQSILFDSIFTGAHSTLDIESAGASGFGATISGFDSRDRIRLSNTIATSATFDDVTNVLTVKNGLTTVATLQMTNDNDDDEFVVTSDGASGVFIETANKAPVITSGSGATAAISVRENTSVPVYTILANDPDGDTLTYTIIGGPDDDDIFVDFNDFDVQLEFFGIPDFESPDDANGDNVYEVIIQVSDGRGGVDTQTVSITVLDNINPIDGDDGPNFLQGFLEGETLRGFGGNDTLDGGFDGFDDDDADRLEGGLGNDIYVLGRGADTVVDTGGIDTITSTITRTLVSYAAIENLTLLGALTANATGNNLANRLTGNSAGNILDGAAGNDTLIGGAGNDTYVLSNGTDTVTDTAGIDTITSTITRSLATYTTIERLTLLGTTTINGTGNTLANTITGNAAANILDGGNGTDTLIGGAGNDVYVLANGTDTVTDSAGIDTITSTITRSLATYTTIENLTLVSANINGTGNTLANVLTGSTGNNILDGGTGNDTLIGNAGNDTLKGGTGLDTLTGSAGSDTFVFNTALNAATNRDTIADFSNVGQNDVMHLENTGAGLFTTLAAGALNAALFKANATGTATDADDRIIYNTATGALFYDANGSAAGGTIQFATLTTKPPLTAADFFVI